MTAGGGLLICLPQSGEILFTFDPIQDIIQAR